MMKFLLNRRNFKPSQRLQLISDEARRIRKLHEAGSISAACAAKMLTELREDPETVLLKNMDEIAHDAA